jgi:hypothetical protein
MWYYVLGALLLGKINGFIGIVDETASLVKNGYRLYQWWYTPRITNGECANSCECKKCHMIDCGIQTD